MSGARARKLDFIHGPGGNHGQDCARSASGAVSSFRAPTFTAVLANTWDYGPLGVELKNNIKRVWWRRFVQTAPRHGRS